MRFQVTAWANVLNVLHRPLPATTPRDPMVRVAGVSAVHAAAFTAAVRPRDDVRPDVLHNLGLLSLLPAFDPLARLWLRHGDTKPYGHLRQRLCFQLLEFSLWCKPLIVDNVADRVDFGMLSPDTNRLACQLAPP